MIKITSSLVTLALLAACQSSGPFSSGDSMLPPPFPPAGEPFVIEYKGAVADIADGGVVKEHEHNRAELEQWGGPVEIRGQCASACAIYLTLPNACMGRFLKVKFHKPTRPVQEGVKRQAKYFRGAMKDKWINEWSKHDKFTVVTARELIKLDHKLKICK